MGRLSFTLDLKNPARRRIRVELRMPVEDITAGTAGRVAEFFLPVWTPGSYLVREYEKHLGDLSFRLDPANVDGIGRRAGGGEAGVCSEDDRSGGVWSGDDRSTLPWRKSRKNRFRVDLSRVPGPADPSDLSGQPIADAGLELVATYELYAHELSVRTSDLTDRHAFLSGAAVYLWPVGSDRADVTIRVETDPAWDVQTSLAGGRIAPGEFELRATSLDELVDSPVLAGEFEVLSFEVLGKPHHLVLDGLDGIAAPDSLVPDTAAIIAQAAAIFGRSVPYEEYKFLCMFTDAGRGGLEHRASSALLAPRTTFAPPRSYRDFMGLVAHEFFHVWNVKRMRPTELWEFDYENENYTELLWVAEGFTAYYDDHLCRRAGVLTSQQYLRIVGDGIAELRRTPGRERQSLSEASYDAWIRLYRPDEDTRNSTLSYYGNGALAALCLDLRIRVETGGERSLDDAVRMLFEQTFGKGRGYTHDDVARALGEVSGGDLSDFLRSLVREPFDPDFGTALAPFGVLVEDEKPKARSYLGVHFKPGTTALSSVLRGSPADRAGLMPQDEILALDGLRASSTQWTELFDQIAGTDAPLDVLVARRGRVLSIQARPEPPRTGGVSITVSPDSSADQDRLRRAWLFDDAI